MRGPGRWWRRKSTPEKVETYTRWSFHSFAVVEFFFVGVTALTPLGVRLGGLVLLMVGVHAVVCFATVSRALDWTRGRRPQPVRLLWTLAAVTAGVAVATIGIAERGPDHESVGTAAAAVFGVVLIFGPGIIALGVRPRWAFGIAGAFAAGTCLVLLALGAPALAAILTAVSVLSGGVFLAFAAVFSVWLLNAVYEIDEARENRARLAVAEERLRFGRDLHDVMGRNLAVIALKSELAVQLAERGRPEAVAQMIEVQRLARESQREVREVVRGYREADLTSELAGAQGVLAAAGISCTVSGGTPVGLPAGVQSALGWVVREAATNVLRHGDAQRCEVRLGVLEGRVVLTVENDGVAEAGSGSSGSSGSSSSSASSSSSGSSGSGLAGLRERLAEIDGRLEAGPAGKGLFRLTAEIPLPPVAVPAAAVRSVREVSA